VSFDFKTLQAITFKSAKQFYYLLI